MADEFATRLATASVKYQNEPFTLKAGGESNWYVDLRRGLSSGSMMRDLGKIAFAKTQSLGLEFEVVASEGVGAAPVQAALLFEALKQGISYKRAEVNKKHEPGERYGYGVHGAKVDGRIVLPVDDTISTASSLITAIEILRDEGAIVNDVLGVVDRSNGKATQALGEIDVAFHSLFTFDESTGQINPAVQ